MQSDITIISARKNIVIYIYKDIYYAVLDDKMGHDVYYINYYYTPVIFILYGDTHCPNA